MRVVIQRAAWAKVEIEGKVAGEIGPGLCVLLGIRNGDGQKEIEWLVKKITQLRIFNDEEDKMNLSVQEINGEILVISQFTLYGESKKGNRPSYIRSARPEVSIPLYEQFVAHLKSVFSGNVATGEFGADMKVSLLNDGPVTLILDTENPTF